MNNEETFTRFFSVAGKILPPVPSLELLKKIRICFPRNTSTWCQFLFEKTDRHKSARYELVNEKGNLWSNFLTTFLIYKGTVSCQTPGIVFEPSSAGITHCEFPVNEWGGSLPQLCFFPHLLMYFQPFPFKYYIIIIIIPSLPYCFLFITGRKVHLSIQWNVCKEFECSQIMQLSECKSVPQQRRLGWVVRKVGEAPCLLRNTSMTWLPQANSAASAILGQVAGIVWDAQWGEEAGSQSFSGEGVAIKIPTDTPITEKPIHLTTLLTHSVQCQYRWPVKKWMGDGRLS